MPLSKTRSLFVDAADAVVVGDIVTRGTEGAEVFTTVLPIANGGTGSATIGASGTVATSNGTVVTWATPSGGGGGGAVPTGDGFYRIVGGVMAAAAMAINLAGGATHVTGVLPVASQAAQAILGDGSGTTAALVVTGLQGRPVSNAAPANTNVLAWNGTAWAPTPAASGGSGMVYPAGSGIVRVAAGVWGTTGNIALASEVSGILPTANQAAQNMAGAVGGTTASNTINLTGNTSIAGTLAAANQAAQTLGGVLGGNTTSATYASAAFGALPISTTGTLAAGASTLGGTTTLSALGGSGAGVVAVSNTGVLSWMATPAGGSSVTWATDLVGSSNTSQIVSALTGSGGKTIIRSTSAILEYIAATAFPSIRQAQQADASAPQSLAIAPQAPGAAAGTAANGTPGSLIVNIAAPVSTGAEGGLWFQRAGSTRVQLSVLPGATTWGAIYLGSVAPSISNYSVASDVSSVAINATIAGALRIGGANALTWSATNVTTATGVDLASARNVTVNGTGSFGGGVGVLCIKDATTVPTTLAGVNLYSQGSMFSVNWRSNTSATLNKLQLDSIPAGTVGAIDSNLLKVTIIDDGGVTKTRYIPLYALLT